MMRTDNNIKQYILDVIDFIRVQVENDRCTMGEMRSLSDALCENIEIDATADDIADFYGKSAHSVRTLADNRRFPDAKKPRRRVYYNFAWLSKRIPAGWARKKNDKTE